MDFNFLSFRWYAGLELFTDKLLWSNYWARLCEIPIWERSAKILGTESKISNPVYETGDYLGVKYEISPKSKNTFMCTFDFHTMIFKYTLLNLAYSCFSVFRKFVDENELICMHGEELEMIKEAGGDLLFF